MTTTFDIPTTSRAAVLTAHSEPLEIHEIPVPRQLEPGALLVMTSHGHTGVRRLFMGSVASDVVKRAPVPVLILRSTADE